MHQYDNTGYPYRVSLGGSLYVLFIKEGSSIRLHITSVVFVVKNTKHHYLKKNKKPMISKLSLGFNTYFSYKPAFVFITMNCEAESNLSP